jgi:hypothetical protein
VSTLMYAVTSWLRWHRPATREFALGLVEQHAEAYYHVLDRKIEFLVNTLENVIREELHAEWDRNGCQPPAPGRAPITQRDLDDAVAELIRDARQEFGRGGAR